MRVRVTGGPLEREGLKPRQMGPYEVKRARVKRGPICTSASKRKDALEADPPRRAALDHKDLNFRFRHFKPCNFGLAE